MSYLHDATNVSPLPPHSLNVIAETDALASLWTILREMPAEAQMPAVKWLRGKLRAEEQEAWNRTIQLKGQS